MSSPKTWISDARVLRRLPPYVFWPLAILAVDIEGERHCTPDNVHVEFLAREDLFDGLAEEIVPKTATQGYGAFIADRRSITQVVEDYRDEAGFDTVMCRAFGSLSEIIRKSGHLCAPAGCILAMKGRYPEQELRGVDPAWHVHAIGKLDVPGLEGDRHIVELRRA